MGSSSAKRAKTDAERELLARLEADAQGRDDVPPAYIHREGTFQRKVVLTADQDAYVTIVRKGMKVFPRACWDNARRAVLKHDPEGRLAYCDGMAFALFERGGIKGHTLAHGWLLLDGEVAVDLTLPLTVAFYGVAFSKTQLLDALDGRRSYDIPSLIDDWQAGWPLIRGKEAARALVESVRAKGEETRKKP